MTLFEALTVGAFDRLNWRHSGESDQNFRKSQMPRGLPVGGGGWTVLELTGTLTSQAATFQISLERETKNNRISSYPVCQDRWRKLILVK